MLHLRDYLAAVGSTQIAFAAASGVPYRTVQRVCSGVVCELRTALQIERYTREHPTPNGEWVSVEDLSLGLPEDSHPQSTG